MKKLSLIIILISLHTFAHAAYSGKCTPSGAGTGFSGTTTYCAGAAATALTYNYTECSSGTGAATGVACTATWYYNSTNTNTISGSTVTVSGPTAFTSAAGANGNLPTVTPVTTTAGTYYYFCVVTWSVTGTCSGPFTTAVQSITINPLPIAISGVAHVCVGATDILSDATSGGTWTSSVTTDASIGSATGIVTGVAGTSSPVITYLLPTGCKTTITITVNPLPAAITGTTGVCTGATTTLGETTAGGSWMSSNTTIATVGSTKIVTGISAGSAAISYVLPTGCSQAVIVTVNQAPSAIAGIRNICVGLTATLSDLVTGGTWSSSAVADATVGSSTGVVAGVAGTTSPVITYTLPSGCKTTQTITINALPAAITGTAVTCPGLTTTLADATSGGTWSSGNNSVATIGSSKIVTCISAGTSVITYALSTGCLKTTTVTVNPDPSAIYGNNMLCPSNTTTMTDATTGGTWSISNAIIATINSSTGLVTVSAGYTGTTTVSYTVQGCPATYVITVNPNPGAIQGATTECENMSVPLTDATAGGTWSAAGDISIVSTGSNAATVTAGAVTGTGTITYKLPDGCMVTATNTVKANPTPILGTLKVCVGAVTILSDATSGAQSWSSSNTAVATSAGADFTAKTGGTSTITYTTTTGCYTTTVLTVVANPAAISGTNMVCSNASLTLSDAAASPYWASTWTSGNTAVATIASATGIVSGVAHGTTIITFSTGCGTNTTFTVSVNQAPANINGNTNVCTGSTTSLSDITTSGTWTSANTAAATINASTGLLTGVATGTANVTYTVPSGCFITSTEVVNSLPAAITITGGGTACNATTLNASNGGSGTIYYQGTTAGGTSIATPSVSQVENTSGNYYFRARSSAGCWSPDAGTAVTINVLSAISGSVNLCSGNTGALTDASAGGTWSSSNTLVAIVDTNGIITALDNGIATITYSLGSVCYATSMVTVNSAPTVSAGNMGTITRGCTSTALHFYTTGSPVNYNIAWSASATAAGFSNVTASPLDTLAQDTVLYISIPSSVAAATYTGTLTVASTGCASGGTTIRAVISDSLNIYTYAGTGAQGYTGNDDAATLAQISHPSAVASDCNGNTYIADYDNGVVRKVDARGVITTFAGNGTIGYSGDGGPATAAQMSTPTGVAIDGEGNVYISDYNNMVIRKVNTAGIISTFAGNGGHGYSGDGGPATAAVLNYPVGLAVDNNNNVYIADYLNSAIRMVTTSGIITTVAGNGVAGYSGDGGYSYNAALNYPRGVAVDNNNNIYIADYGNNVIRKVSNAGIINTFAGVGIAGYAGDGNLAVLAQLNNPWGIAVDGYNNVYFSELHNNIVRKVDSNGIISTIGGSSCGCDGYMGDGHQAILARLNQPMGISINCSGNLFIADNANYAVRILGNYNRAPFFAAAAQSIEVSQSAPVASLNSVLAVTDFDTLQNEKWTVATNAANGTLSVAYSTTTNGSLLTPSGLTYTPAPGYTGLDSFRIQVSDGMATATETIYVTVTESAGRMANTGVNNAAANNISLQVFPNPAKGNFSVKTSGAGTFYLLSMAGQMVGEYAVTDEQTAVNLPAGLPSGVYVGRFRDADGHTTEVKLVIEQ